MAFFKDVAIALVARNIPVIPLRPRTKIAFLEKWEQKATTDLKQIEAWDEAYPDANCGSVALAKPDSIWILELDSQEALQRINAETGKTIPPTFAVRSSPGRGHFYFRQTPASLAMGNIAQSYVKHTDWSARVDRQYVVSPGSIHPSTGLPYELRSTAELAEGPQWLIDWLLSQRVEKAIADEAAESEMILQGGRNSKLASVAGKLRNMGFDREMILNSLLDYNETHCSPPLPDEEVEAIAHSIARYAIGKDDTCLIGGKPAGSVIAIEPESPPVGQKRLVAYPDFPDKWILEGTSVYEGFCKPISDVNMRYNEFMFMPAMAVILNYLSTRVHIAYKSFPLSLYLALIGKRGTVIKSSSVEDAIEYCKHAGIVDYGGPQIRNAEGKSLVYTAGSTEGVGLEMARSSCNNAILYYDELSVLVSKAGIESSSMMGHLLQNYEAALFANQTKGKSFCIPPSSYCFSLIACSTDDKFLSLWSKLSGGSTGLDDRFFFLYQPKILKDYRVMRAVSTIEAAAETRKLIDRAVKQGVYKIVNDSPLAARTREIGGNRPEIRAEKFALFFAVDLGRDEIDDDCVERALTLAEYERKTKRYLHLFEASTQEGSVQMQILDHLRRVDGTVEVRKLQKATHAESYGTSVWLKAYNGLIGMEWIVIHGTGGPGDPRRAQITEWAPDYEDD